MDGRTVPPTARQRVVARAVRLLAAVASRAPAGLAHRVAHAAGTAWYLAAPGGRAMARANLRRICEALVASGEATPRLRAAATDRRELDRLVRSAFQHRARYYLEVLTAPLLPWERLQARIDVDPEARRGLEGLDRALQDRPGGPYPLLLGMHFGLLEMTLSYVTQKHGIHAVAPMETIGNPALQAYLEETRGASGVRLLDLETARRELRRALAGGELVGIVADRDVSGAGAAVALFGHAAHLPAGPAILAVDSGVGAYAAGVRRTGWGRYAPRLIPILLPREGTVRDRVRRFLEAEVRAFESLVADAPEQWTAVFFPIWPDLPGGARP